MAIRARVTNALDLLQGKDGSEERERAREELEQAEKALRSAELQLAGVRLRPSGSTAQALLEAEGDHRDAETRKWLLRTFTDQDVDTAECNHELGAVSPRTPGLNRRSSIQERFEHVHRVVADADMARILERTGHFDFDALALAKDPGAQGSGLPITILGTYLVQKHRLIRHLEDQGRVTGHAAFEQALLCFFEKLDHLYRGDVAYHSAVHAVDVTATTEWLMRSQYIRDRTSQLDHFMSLVAAAIHDVGHPGKNNLFHSKTMSPLAIRYNDKSILENMHIALAFETMQSDPESDWFSLLPRDVPGQAGSHDIHLQQYVRKGLIAMVLATDMAKHSTHVQELKSFVEEPEELDLMSSDKPADKQRALERKLFLLETVVHAADISNPCKPQQLMLGWTCRVLAEFWEQGDEERRLGLEVSPLCDRATGATTVPKGQIGFISFVVQPFFEPLAELIEEAKEATAILACNKQFWQSKDEANATFDEIFPQGLNSYLPSIKAPSTKGPSTEVRV